MESKIQITQNTYLLESSSFSQEYSEYSFYCQFQKLFRIAFLNSLLILFCLVPAFSFAAPPEHTHSVVNNDLLPEPARHKKNNVEPFARGRILVQPRAGLPAKVFADILKEHDGKVRKIGQSSLYIVDLPEYAEEGVTSKLAQHPLLKFVELDYSVSPSLVPDDPYYGSGWHLTKVGTPIAWDNSQGGGITIAILDSGVENSHPDLASQMVTGWNFYDNNSDSLDVRGHGTAVAGVAAATTNNGIGVAGIAGWSKIMPLRVTDTNGIGYSSTISQAIVYAADHSIRIANASFQGLTNSLTLRNAAQYMKDKNGLVLVSAGNTGMQENHTVTTTMIPVSATDLYDEKASFSSYGNYVALAAPGNNFYSTRLGGDYIPVAGTSFSSPVAAGVIALMMSANPTLNNLEIENLLYSTAVDLGDPGRDPYFGHGRVDAAAAVQAALNALPSVDAEMPVAAITDPLDGSTVAGLVPVDIEATDNVGVTRAELWVNNTVVAVDSSTPFAFAWDSSGVPDGVTTLVAHVFDAAGNKTSSTVSVNVANQVEPPAPTIDTEPPIVQIINPVNGNVSGQVTISVDASDNNGASGITQSIYIDDSLVATGKGSTLAYNWNTRTKKVSAGKHTIQATAMDAAGNASSVWVNVNVIK